MINYFMLEISFLVCIIGIIVIWQSRNFIPNQCKENNNNLIRKNPSHWSWQIVEIFNSKE